MAKTMEPMPLICTIGGTLYTDVYPRIFTERKGTYIGQVADVYEGLIYQCKHSHKKRSTALACARQVLARMISEDPDREQGSIPKSQEAAQ